MQRTHGGIDRSKTSTLKVNNKLKFIIFELFLRFEDKKISRNCYSI